MLVECTCDLETCFSCYPVDTSSPEEFLRKLRLRDTIEDLLINHVLSIGWIEEADVVAYNKDNKILVEISLTKEKDVL